MSIYLDNASTSFPKPKEVLDSINNFMINLGGNSGRGSSSSSLKSSHVTYNCREAVAQFFNFNKSENVIFTNNITSSLNILLNSIVQEGWHVITSTMEHNSVLRPLFKLKEERNIELTVVQADNNGFVAAADIDNAIKDNTKLVILSQASNVTGNIQPLKEIGELCRKKSIYFIIDTAQSAGGINVDFKELNCNALAFTGHKGLLGPQGIGGFIIDDDLNDIAKPVFVGGTGSMSYSLVQPDFLPDKFESGTLNTPGIAGLYSAINYINKETINAIHTKEMYLSRLLLDDLNNMDYITLYGPNTTINRLSTFSINLNDMNSNEFSYYLDSKYNIITRTGLHCAPLAHKTIGTENMGTVRISIGYFNTVEDIKSLIDAIYHIHKGV
ncbi:MAG: aminotransferase class V-fold PLP-dependent enzyme [Inconstantimicrobium porci]|uniref:aminotransferase class V-fold PLP-dependent enzyme n=1 Tax=Inconstantimicrobium porci TaxID=2652291 RepID=UPI002A91AF52|nr:aminotransferase class V-fold PLP-dependent enzyme [Inconstantimicrobium porci]MDY5912672.1 aminotransferase class V-fold PLP-dependent enzyme [Inconstantimicrobium porci]